MRIHQIETAVRTALRTMSLMVVDESHLHRGHAGARPFGQSHYHIFAISEAFNGQSRVARQRLIFGVLGATVGEEIHALTMTLLTPEEAR